MLYIAFSRAIRDEAARIFPPNVECRTSHQIAFDSIGKLYTHKLQNNLRLTDIVELVSDSSWSVAKDVLNSIANFMVSADQRILDTHFPASTSGRAQQAGRNIYRSKVLDLAERVWQEMIDLESDFPITHDGYLKLYQLSMPILSGRYRTILFDEAQDSNPVTNHIVLQQQCKIVYVGDDHQQIYRFRGADNALNTPLLQSADILYLTNSFRFGPQIAAVANALLSLKHETKPVVGRRIGDNVILRLTEIPSQYAVLSRTVMGVIATALVASLAGKRVYWVGKINAYQLADLESLYWLERGQSDRINNKKILATYKTFHNYESIAKATKDSEMLRSLAILETYDDIPSIIQLMYAQSVSDQAEADIIVSTSHRCKGLQWQTVVLDDDFPDIFDPKLGQEVRDDEINLLYVACTRAETTLVINSIVYSVIQYAKAIAKRNSKPAAEANH